LLETWLAAKGKPVRETNISDWRRTICGDLSSVFQPYDGTAIKSPFPIERDATVERIYSAKFQRQPGAPAAATVDVAAMQETGVRPSAPLPYALHGNIEPGLTDVTLVLEARDDVLGARSQGAPFNAYRYGTAMISRAYAVKAGASLRDTWKSAGAYHFRVDGPNGFMREFIDGATRSALRVTVDHPSGPAANGDIRVRITNRGGTALTVALADESYHAASQQTSLDALGTRTFVHATSATHGWYNLSVRCGALTYRYAGRVETGKWSISDPAMGGE
jgi:phospholipase C